LGKARGKEGTTFINSIPMNMTEWNSSMKAKARKLKAESSKLKGKRLECWEARKLGS
jgi:hypothetical protein